MTVGKSFRDRPSRESATAEVGSWRFWLVGALLTLCAIALLARGLYLQYFNQDFLERQGNARILRDVKLSANRGMVLDRNGEPLAVSTPVDTVWADPRKLAQHPQEFARLAQALGRDKNWLARRVTSNLDREFVYLVRHMRPQDADKVKALGIPGVDTLREYRRYYPAGEVTGHLLGFTNVDDVGQEGLELAFDEWLGGVPGVKRVMRDREGRTLEDIELIKAPRPGQDLRTSIDLRVQYLAYRALKQAVQVNEAQGGSVVVLDIETGEVLAMVNQPAFNPNDREQYLPSRYRNRATNDFFEPGSSIKPFIVGAAMKTGRFHCDTLIETGPGTLRVGIKTIKDKHNLGTIDVCTVPAEIEQRRHGEDRADAQAAGDVAVIARPGLRRGHGLGLPRANRPASYGLRTLASRSAQATMAYGYGLSVTPLQLAQAYAVLGAGGIRRPVSLRRVDVPPAGEQIMEPAIARELVQMLENVVSEAGTARRAAVMGYRVSGKTGTAWKAANGGYNSTKYMAVFGGVVPASNPRLAALVVVDEPSAGRFYGGDVAAPVFAEVMSGALRLLAIAPDDLQRVSPTTVVQAQDPW